MVVMMRAIAIMSIQNITIVTTIAVIAGMSIQNIMIVIATVGMENIIIITTISIQNIIIIAMISIRSIIIIAMMMSVLAMHTSTAVTMADAVADTIMGVDAVASMVMMKTLCHA